MVMTSGPTTNKAHESQVDQAQVSLRDGPQAGDAYEYGTVEGVHSGGVYQEFQGSFGGTPVVLPHSNVSGLGGSQAHVQGTPTSGSFQVTHDAAAGSVDAFYHAVGPS